MSGEIVAPYATQLVTGLVAGLVAIGMYYNKHRRDTSNTDKTIAMDDSSTKFVQNLVEDHKILSDKLSAAERDRTANAEKIGALSAEVGLLRANILEVKNMLLVVTTQLQDSDSQIRNLLNEINIRDGRILKLTIEKDALADRFNECKSNCTRGKVIHGPT